MISDRPLKIGITCYPSVGGSGILASALGEELARRGHEVHFISYERPFRMPAGVPRLFFHPVQVNDYALFKYPDYTLPLSVKMAEVSRDCGLDVLHVHYAVPHATAAILARSMLPPGQQPRVVTTLHGTDTTLLGRDPGYGPAITHALETTDAIHLADRVVGHDGLVGSEIEELAQLLPKTGGVGRDGVIKSIRIDEVHFHFTYPFIKWGRMPRRSLARWAMCLGSRILCHTSH